MSSNCGAKVGRKPGYKGNVIASIGVNPGTCYFATMLLFAYLCPLHESKDQLGRFRDRGLTGLRYSLCPVAAVFKQFTAVWHQHHSPYGF